MNDPRKIPRILLVLSIVTIVVAAFAVGFKVGEHRANAALDQMFSRHLAALCRVDPDADFVRGDGIRQGCEWCGDRCDGYLRGWRQAEAEEAGTR